MSVPYLRLYIKRIKTFSSTLTDYFRFSRTTAILQNYRIACAQQKSACVPAQSDHSLCWLDVFFIENNISIFFRIDLGVYHLKCRLYVFIFNFVILHACYRWWKALQSLCFLIYIVMPSLNKISYLILSSCNLINRGSKRSIPSIMLKGDQFHSSYEWICNQNPTHPWGGQQSSRHSVQI